MKNLINDYKYIHFLNIYMHDLYDCLKKMYILTGYINNIFHFLILYCVLHINEQ